MRGYSFWITQSIGFKATSMFMVSTFLADKKTTRAASSLDPLTQFWHRSVAKEYVFIMLVVDLPSIVTGDQSEIKTIA
jgi:hypothetical protein